MQRREFIGGAAGLFAGAVALGGCRGGACRAGSRGVPYTLGIAGYTYKAVKTDEMLARMERLGVRHLCVKNFHLPFDASDAQIREFAAKCRDHGVEPDAYGPIDVVSEGEARARFEQAKKLGCRTIVGVPLRKGATPDWTHNVQDRAMCELVDRLCGEYDVDFAIHNHGPDMPECYPTGAGACEFVKDLSPRVGICLDIGHEVRGGADPVATIRAWSGRIFDVHLKDIVFPAPGNADVARVLGKGDLDLPAVLRALADVGYSRRCSLEYEANFEDNVPDVAACVGYYNALTRCL